MASIEDRLRAIEDRLEIYNLIASHPPSANTGADYFTRLDPVKARTNAINKLNSPGYNVTLSPVTAA